MQNQQEHNEDNTAAVCESEEELVLDSKKIQDYETEIANLQNQIDTLQDRLLRTIAESENTRKRLEKLIDDTRDYSIVNFAKDLLNVSDNLSRALEHQPKNIDNEVQNIIAGVKMTKDELMKIFQNHGLKIIEPLVGEKFDCKIHNAVAQIETNDYSQDSVVSTMQLGYSIKDRLLRPASVTVSKKSE